MDNKNANGFSLIEIIVAIVVLAVGMLAMAASTGYMSAEIRNSTFNTQRLMAREQIIERLRATPFDNVASSASVTTVGRFDLTWTVTFPNNNLKQVLVIAAGPAYRTGRGPRTNVVDTVLISLSRP
jgi:prepilin-type N-terminal cleavage/methylation domain-containing protein